MRYLCLPLTLQSSTHPAPQSVKADKYSYRRKESALSRCAVVLCSPQKRINIRISAKSLLHADVRLFFAVRRSRSIFLLAQIVCVLPVCSCFPMAPKADLSPHFGKRSAFTLVRHLAAARMEGDENYIIQTSPSNRTTFGVEERIQIVKDIEQQIMDDSACLTFCYPTLNVVSQKNVTGVTTYSCDYYWVSKNTGFTE